MNLGLLSVELSTLGLGLVLFLADLFMKDGSSRRPLAIVSALGYLAILIHAFGVSAAPAQAFGGMYLQDGLSQVFREIFLAAAFLTSLASAEYLDKTRMRWQGEYYVMLALATAGMMFMATAGDFLSLYIALETTTITFYALTAMHKASSPVSSEAGLKYLLLGAFSSSVLLYGISLFYGLSGTTSLAGLGSWLAAQPAGAPPVLLVLATVLVLAGFAFKITLVPFHMWSPDVYQGAPTPVTGLLSVGSKAAGFAAVVRIFLFALNHGPVAELWSFLLATLAALTFLVANLIALKQHNIKRLLAYSSISQAGYLILGLLANSALGKQALVFYLILYVFTNLAAFTVVTLVCHRTGAEEIDDFKGLAQTSPLLALVMMLSLLSLAGIPPMAGFFGKFYLFAAGIQAKWLGLVTWAVVNSIVSLFYYLVVIKKMYLEAPASTSARPSGQPWTLNLALTVCAFFVLFLGVFPTPVLTWLESVLK